MAAQYNQDRSGLGSELEEPRRTHDQVNAGGFGGQNEMGVGGYGAGRDQVNTGGEFGTQGQNTGFGREGQVAESGYGGGYGGVSEEVPPRHKLHSEDEPLPAPAPGTYDDNLPATQPRDVENYGTDRAAGERVMPHTTVGGEDYSDAPQSTEDYQGYRDTQTTQNFDDAPVETRPRTGLRDEGVNEGGYADPSAAFPGAPVDRRLEEPGYGYNDQKKTGLNTDLPDETVTPNETFAGKSGTTMDPSAPTGTPHQPINTTMGTGAPKKEGLITKLKEKLPGGHKSTDTAEHDTAVDDTTGAPHKKGLITKLKEKLPGHHNTE